MATSQSKFIPAAAPSAKITRVAMNSIVLRRDGETKVVEPGETFDFTREEIDSLPESALSTKVTVDLADIPKMAPSDSGPPAGGGDL